MLFCVVILSQLVSSIALLSVLVSMKVKGSNTISFSFFISVGGGLAVCSTTEVPGRVKMSRLLALFGGCREPQV